MEVAKLVTQPFCKETQVSLSSQDYKTSSIRGAHYPQRWEEGVVVSYVALEGALEDQLFSHGDNSSLSTTTVW